MKSQSVDLTPDWPVDMDAVFRRTQLRTRKTNIAHFALRDAFRKVGLPVRAALRMVETGPHGYITPAFELRALSFEDRWLSFSLATSWEEIAQEQADKRGLDYSPVLGSEIKYQKASSQAKLEYMNGIDTWEGWTDNIARVIHSEQERRLKSQTAPAPRQLHRPGRL